MFRILSLIIAASTITTVALAQREDRYVMAAIGDSITKAFNSGGFFIPRPRNSWSAGSSKYVESHKTKLENYFDMSVDAYNFAKSGSEIRDLNVQVREVLRLKPDYLTVLIGANDVCGWDEDYEAELNFYAAELARHLDRIVETIPDIKILLVSIPDIYQLQQLGSKNQCQSKWNFTHFCSAMLGQDRTEADRLLVAEKWERANAALEALSENYPENVKFAASVKNYQFAIDEVSKVDCFHPSVAGQKKLADETWADSWFQD